MSPEKIKSLVQLYELLPENEKIIVDVLRHIVIDTLPRYCKEKISFNVPTSMVKKEFVSSGLLQFQEEGSKKVFFLDFGMGIGLMM
jgi:hypothetical protein